MTLLRNMNPFVLLSGACIFLYGFIHFGNTQAGMISLTCSVVLNLSGLMAALARNDWHHREEEEQKP